MGVALLTVPLSYVRHWICIMDHSIQVGTKKVFVMLRIPIERMKQCGALCLKDAEVIHLSIREKWNGETVHEEIRSVFQHYGFPEQIVIDEGCDLKKALRLNQEETGFAGKITHDLTHRIANWLEKKYSQLPIFKNLLSLLGTLRQKVLQTPFAHLVPPKQRNKARFMNLPELKKWTKHVFPSIVLLLKQSDNGMSDSVRQSFQAILPFQDFLETLAKEMETLDTIQQLSKTSGLTFSTYQEIITQIKMLSDSIIRANLFNYFETEAQFIQTIDYPSLLSSDVIESLFGKYKQIAKPHCMSEINRLVLLMPIFCTELTVELIQKSFECVKTQAVQEWISKVVGKTIFAERKLLYQKTTNLDR